MTDVRVDRVAKPADAAGIFDVLKEVSAEIPVLIDGREDALHDLIKHCIGTRKSLVSVDKTGHVIAFILIGPDKSERIFGQDKGALHLHYGGVVTKERGQGIFKKLMEKAKARRVLLTATVKTANRCNMASRLQRFGFQMTASDLAEQRFRRY